MIHFYVSWAAHKLSLDHLRPVFFLELLHYFSLTLYISILANRFYITEMVTLFKNYHFTKVKYYIHIFLVLQWGKKNVMRMK